MLLVCWAPIQKGQQAQQPAPLPDTNTGVQTMNVSYIKVWRSIMAPKNVADTFGHRIASKYIAMQVTIANRNKDYQWLIQDASVDIRRLLDQEKQAGRKCDGNLPLLLAALEKESTPQDKDGNLKPIKVPSDYSTPGDYARVTSADLTVLRGVAEKGQSLDPRNMTVRSFTAAGVIAAGLIGVTRFGHSYAPGVAAFNGPLLSALQEVLPDYTVNQLNRLNDSAFLTNTVVGKQQAKVIVLFIPQSDLLTSAQQKIYYKDPESVYSCPDLRMLEANVDGNFIANVTGTPVATAVTIDSSEAAKFQTDNFTVNGSVTGNFFTGATIELVSPPSGLTLKQTGDATDTTIKFSLSDAAPLPSGTSLDFAIKGKTGDPVHVNYTLNYAAPAPTVESAAPTSIKAGEKTSITLTGTHFFPQGMKVLLDPSKDLTPGAIDFISTTQIKFDVAASASATAGNVSLTVSTPGGGSSPKPVTLAVTK
jgi:hypothetical protein